MNILIFATTVALLSFSSTVCANRTDYVAFNGIEDRIIRGKLAAVGQFPWQISMLASNSQTKDKSLCGGSLISNRHALTAAHCCYEQEIFELGIGTNKFDWNARNFLRITKMCIIHPQYNPETLANDIAILVFYPIKLSKYIQIIRLPGWAERSKYYANATAIASGWGKTENGRTSTNLRYVDLLVITNKECKDTWSITNKVICAKGTGGRSTCSGDSGGPLITKSNDRWTLIGATSFGGSSCLLGLPVGFTRISKYLSWIHSYIRK